MTDGGGGGTTGHCGARTGRPPPRGAGTPSHLLEAALEDADIATGDYGHRLCILVDQYAKRNPGAGNLRKWAQQLSAPEHHKEAQSAYLELRKAFTPNWNSYYNEVIQAYEEELLANAG
jgi:hypothetical protein